jgi:hypothetical protein
MRLSQRLKRTGKRRVTVPPVTEPERERKISDLAEQAKDLREQIEATGGFVREGGGEKTRPVPLHETLRGVGLWGKKPPPEWGEK